MANPDRRTDPPRRPLRATHVVIIVVLLAVLASAAFGFWRLAGSAGGEGPSTTADTQGTTQQEAQARSRGQAREGSNSSQDAYTSQNQSREPERR